MNPAKARPIVVPLADLRSSQTVSRFGPAIRFTPDVMATGFPRLQE